MINLGKALGLMLATMLGLVIFTEYDGGNSVSRIFGYPIVSVAQSNPVGLIAIGQAFAQGVIVIAQAGAGIICFAQGGVGILFGLGQAQAGLINIAQVGVGILFFLGQGGLSIQAIGQGVFYSRPVEYFQEMLDEFSELLAPPFGSAKATAKD